MLDIWQLLPCSFKLEWWKLILQTGQNGRVGLGIYIEPRSTPHSSILTLGSVPMLQW